MEKDVVICERIEGDPEQSPSTLSTLSVLDFALSEKFARLSFLGELGGDEAAGGVDAARFVSSIPARVSAACTSASKVLRSFSNVLWSRWPRVRRALRDELGGRDTGVKSGSASQPEYGQGGSWFGRCHVKVSCSSDFQRLDRIW